MQDSSESTTPSTAVISRSVRVSSEYSGRGIGSPSLYPRRSVAPARLRASDSSVSERDALAEATFIDGDLDDPAAHLDLIEQFEPIHHLAKHGVTAIEMGCG